MKNTTFAEYGRLRVRETTDSELDLVLAMEQDDENSDNVLQWPRERHLELIADANCGHWVFEDVDGGHLIGYAILHGISASDRILHFNRLVIAEKGKGYGRDAIRLVKKVAFEELNIHRLWFDVFADNERAINLYRSEGFFDEGTQRDCIFHGGRYRSQMIFSMLSNEYQAQ